MKLKTLGIAGFALLLAAPASAHHSFAMFDREKSLTMTGVVKEFEWTNPHVWIHVWRADSVKPGDKVSVDFHPLKDGSRGGQLVAATLADGKRLGGPVRRPAAQE